jgi:TRAP-type C4-dicarboxylate transport system permease large subunit
MGADCNSKNGRTVKLRRQGGASRIAEAFQPISLFLPPIGLGVFTGCSIGKVNVTQVAKPLLPYLGLNFTTVLLITYWPWLTMAIPKFLFK